RRDGGAVGVGGHGPRGGRGGQLVGAAARGVPHLRPPAREPGLHDQETGDLRDRPCAVSDSSTRPSVAAATSLPRSISASVTPRPITGSSCRACFTTGRGDYAARWSRCPTPVVA